jgi:hypothetical protein
VKSKSGNINILHGQGRVQCGELHPEPLRMMGLNPGTTSSLEEPFKSFMPKRPDHP